jgi:hypothetical protein
MNITHIRKPVEITKLLILQKIIALKAYFTNTRPLLNKETIRTLQHSFQYETTKIEKTIDHRFKDLENTLEDIVPYYMDKYNL